MSSTVDPTLEDRARGYPKLESGATLGTVCEYDSSGEWAIITDLPDRTWGDVFDGDDEQAEEKVVRFLNLDKLPDVMIRRFEQAAGCYEHVDIAREYRDAEGAGNFVRRSDFHEKFCVLGPVHPDARGER